MKLSDFANPLPPAVVAANYITSQGMKASVVVFDTQAGTRFWMCPFTGPARVFLVGPGGGSNSRTPGPGGGYAEFIFTLTQGVTYSYTVGAPGNGSAAGSSTSWGGVFSATAGGPSGPGAGVGGAINHTGGAAGANDNGGSSSGNRFMDGLVADGLGGGAGWLSRGDLRTAGGYGGVDGYGVGLPPGKPGLPYFLTGASSAPEPAGYGCGGGGSAATSAFGNPGDGGIGGGGGSSIFVDGGGARFVRGAPGGIGGGAGANTTNVTPGFAYGGPGLVGIERL